MEESTNQRGEVALRALDECRERILAIESDIDRPKWQPRVGPALGEADLELWIEDIRSTMEVVLDAEEADRFFGRFAIRDLREASESTKVLAQELRKRLEAVGREVRNAPDKVFGRIDSRQVSASKASQPEDPGQESDSAKPNRLERIVNWFKDHPVFSIILFVGVLLVGLEKVVKAYDFLTDRWGSQPEEVREETTESVETRVVVVWAPWRTEWRHVKTKKVNLTTVDRHEVRARPGDPHTSPDGKWSASYVEDSIGVESEGQRLTGVEFQRITGATTHHTKGSEIDKSGLGARAWVKCWSSSVTYQLSGELEERFESAGPNEQLEVDVSGGTLSFTLPSSVASARLEGLIGGQEFSLNVGESNTRLQLIGAEPTGEATRYEYALR